MFEGDPATVSVELRLDGGTIVPITSLHLVPNEGHIHLYLDDALLSMTGLDTQIIVLPGTHTLRAEFVAVDHGPFRPPVVRHRVPRSALSGSGDPSGLHGRRRRWRDVHDDGS